MPRATIWIRNEDWDEWQLIANKSEWLHNRLKQEPAIKDLPTRIDTQATSETLQQYDHAQEFLPDEPTYTDLEDAA